MGDIYMIGKGEPPQEQCGEKAHSIARAYPLVKVPEGIIISRKVFDDFLERSQIRKKILNLLLLNSDERLQEIANDIQRMIVTAEIPKDMADRIVDAYQSIGLSSDKPLVEMMEKEASPEVIIRPSPIPTPSIQRLHMPFYKVSGRKDLLRNIKMCWASLYTYNAIRYRRDNGIDEAGMALLIQQFKDIQSSLAVLPFDLDSSDPAKYSIIAVLGYGMGLDDDAVQKDIYSITKQGLEPEIRSVSLQGAHYTFDIDKPRPQLIKIQKERGAKQKIEELYMIEAAKAMNKLATRLNQSWSGEFGLDKNKSLFLLELKATEMPGSGKPDVNIEEPEQAEEQSGEQLEEQAEEQEFIEFDEKPEAPDELEVVDTEDEKIDIVDEPDIEEIQPQDAIATEEIEEDETLSREFEKKEDKKPGISLFNLFKKKGEEPKEDDVQPREVAQDEAPVQLKEEPRKEITVTEEDAWDISALELVDHAKSSISQAVILADMAITRHMKKRFSDLFAEDPDLGFEDLLERLADKQEIPMEAEIRKVRALRDKFLANYRPIKPEQTDFAVQTAERFIKEF